jgi:hypothetical protein
VVDIILVVDGTILVNDGFERLTILNTPGLTQNLGYWSIATTLQLTPGSHTIEVGARGIGIGSNAIVSGDSTSVIQGSLNILILKT